MVATIRIDNSGTIKMMAGLKKIPKGVKRATGAYSKLVVRRLRSGLMNSERATSSRALLKPGIKAKRKSNSVSVIQIPRQAFLLDSMKPHYVALKRGRKIRSWVNKHYGNLAVSRKSRVFFGPRGGIVHKKGKKSALYVTPDPFIEKSLRGTEKKLAELLGRDIGRALRGG